MLLSLHTIIEDGIIQIQRGAVSRRFILYASRNDRARFGDWRSFFSLNGYTQLYGYQYKTDNANDIG